MKHIERQHPTESTFNTEQMYAGTASELFTEGEIDNDLDISESTPWNVCQRDTSLYQAFSFLYNDMYDKYKNQ